MRIVIAPDAFKSCLSAAEVAQALAAGWCCARPEDTLELVPMADGGEGTADALVAAAGGEHRTVRVSGPLGAALDAQYGVLDAGATAVIEMAAAAGLPLLTPVERDPLLATTHGVGALIRHAMEGGARRILLGLGGSATNDAGAGMAQALGFRLLDEAGAELPPGGAALARLARIDASGVMPELAECGVAAACDVDNPLCGPHGASHVYGPQKGASPKDVEVLDAALACFAEVAARDLGVQVRDVSGAGAAGGMGAGVLAFLGGTLEPGAELVASACGLGARMDGADLVITGEGRIDGQTVRGKTPAGVARLAKARGIRVVAVCGALGEGYEAVRGAGIDAVFSVAPGPCTLEEAMEHAAEHLRRTAEELARYFDGLGGVER